MSSMLLKCTVRRPATSLVSMAVDMDSPRLFLFLTITTFVALREYISMYTTIRAAAAAIRQHEATPLDLLEQCLERVEQYEDKVKAWVFLDRESAREQAQRLTAE